MLIEIDDKSGFCFGVVKAISTAEKSLAELGKVYSLGDIVHNRIEVQRLERLGLQTISHAQFPSLEGQTVLIRAHGEPPSTYHLAKKHGIRLEHLDYVQIHPTTLYSKKPGRRFLISESVRGEGAVLYNKKHERFVNELLPRDVVTKAIHEEMEKDGTDYVWLSNIFQKKRSSVTFQIFIRGVWRKDTM